MAVVPMAPAADGAHHQITGMMPGKTNFPVYDAAVLGFREYWYPVTWSREIGRKGAAFTLLGDSVVLFRAAGKVYALHNRCLHRGVPLDGGRQDFPGTVSCPYHGWVYELATGRLKAALTDGPDSPIVKAADLCLRTYPVEERAGLVWIYMGEHKPPPVEDDIPPEFLDPHAVILGRINERPGDWRYAAENGHDDAHVKYLHRRGVWTFWRRAAAWGYSRPHMTEDGKWVTRTPVEIGFGGEFPGLGYWPKKRFWKWRRIAPTIKIRLPGQLRVNYPRWAHYEWYVPTTPGRHRYPQFVVKSLTGLPALWLKLRYYLYIQPFFHRQFNNQDAWMVESMRTPPEMLFRPDSAMIFWRRYVEANHRR